MIKWKLSAALLLCLLAVLVQSESSIEVDENGDEYDVKRFNIEGRQLGGGSQCVLTRRKRQSSTEDMNSGENVSQQKNGAELITTPTTPVSGVDTATTGDENGDGEEDDQGLLGDGASNENPDDDMANEDQQMVAGEDEDMDEEDEDDNDNDDNGSSPQNSAALLLAIKDSDDEDESENGDDEGNGDGDDEGENLSQHIALVAGHPQPIVLPSSEAATEQVHGAGAGGVVLVHSHVPPQVNPQTHALFELHPVNHAVQDGVDADGQLHYEEEISPVSTTAIWSTGDDNNLIDDDLYDDYDIDVSPNKGSSRPGKGGNKVKPTKKRPLKNRKKSKRRPSRRPAYSYNRKGNRKGRPNKKRPKKNKNKNKKNRRPSRVTKNKNKKNKRPRRPLRKVRPVRRRRPASNQSTTVRKQIANSNRNKNVRDKQNSNRRLNANLSNRDINRKRLNKLENIDKGTNTFTKTETMTQTGSANDQKDVNCIIINKPPPPTTARPFWNVFGRNADGDLVRGNRGQQRRHTEFGLRKRANMRV